MKNKNNNRPAPSETSGGQRLDEDLEDDIFRLYSNQPLDKNKKGEVSPAPRITNQARNIRPQFSTQDNLLDDQSHISRLDAVPEGEEQDGESEYEEKGDGKILKIVKN